jgi:pimeloyl-ACP methyl ester carboxylesterase
LNREIYIFSGLGADERAFQRLDFSGYSINFIKWVLPNVKDTIESYATRLLEQIKTKKPILIGLSFGGIMAIEIAKQIETENVILIASAKTKNEIPFYFRLVGMLELHRLLPIDIITKSNFFTYWFFGAKPGFEEKLLKQILKDSDTTFMSWAIDKIAKWSNVKSIENVFHIHGSKDRILPLRFIKCNSVIINGGHFMTLNKANEISKVIRKEVG